MLSATLTLLVLTAGGSGCNCDDLQAEVDALKKRVEALEKRPSAARPPERAEQAEAWDIPVGDSPVLGPKDAPVKLVIFSDIQCPFCARVHPLLNDVVNDPELKGKVAVVWKHFPLSFHKDARPAAYAAMAAREQNEQAFWTMVARLYENQRNLQPEIFEQLALESDLKVKSFRDAMAQNQSRYDRILDEDMRLGQKINVRGTPSLFVGGWELRQRSVEGVKEIIREKKLLEQGGKKAKKRR